MTSMAHHIKWDTLVDRPPPYLACNCAVVVQPHESSESEARSHRTATALPRWRRHSVTLASWLRSNHNDVDSSPFCVATLTPSGGKLVDLAAGRR